MKQDIGVFDSGIGGLTILKELITSLSGESFIYFADSKNAPYGIKTAEEILKLSEKILDFFIQKNCKLVVIACNTATAAAVEELRKKYAIPIIGLEPAVKPACLSTKTGKIGVLATEGTFRGNHFKNTSEKYKDYVDIYLQVAKQLVELAELGIFSGNEVNENIELYINPLKKENVDKIVLGCTHYAFFIDSIKKIAGENIEIIDSAQAVTKRTKDILILNRIFNTQSIYSTQKIEFYTSGNTKIIQNLVETYLNIKNNIVQYLLL